MGKRLKKIVSFLISASIILLLMIGAWSVLQIYNGAPVAKVFGWGQAVVLTGSMEPIIPVNSLIIFQEQSEYKVGDVIIYYSDDLSATVTHRISAVADETIITKGDANNAYDKPIVIDDVIGRIRFVFPKVGAVIRAIQTPVGILASMSILGIAYIVPDLKLLNRRNCSNEAGSDQKTEC